MSNVSMFLKPGRSCATQSAPVTPPAGPAHQQLDRRALRRCRMPSARRRSAARAACALTPRSLQLVVADFEIFADDGPHVGVGDRGQRALVFVHLRQDLATKRDRACPAVSSLGDLADAPLVRAVRDRH